jgi:hypothetical protein
VRVVTVTCDKCQCEIRQDRHVFRIETGVPRRIGSEVDLCGPCTTAFEHWLQTPPVAAVGRASGPVGGPVRDGKGE